MSLGWKLAIIFVAFLVILVTVIYMAFRERTLGKGGPWRVVIDPVDGSLNAKRGLPLYALSIAIADGPTMADVVLGYVYDLGNGEEWIARRPWEGIRAPMEDELGDLSWSELCFGTAFLAAASPRRSSGRI